MNDRTDRIHGALLGLAAGDALGATLEFFTEDSIEKFHKAYGLHRDIVGGGAFGWRPGQGTDDTDLAIALARVYANGYDLYDVADGFLDWAKGKPRDIGGTTHAALAHYHVHGDPRTAGVEVWTEKAAGNGSLMRALATGLVVHDPVARANQATEISMITHADTRCVEACIAYVNIVNHLIHGMPPFDAVRLATIDAHNDDVRNSLQWALTASLENLDPSGYVLSSLEIAVWAIMQPTSLEDTLIAIVNLGDDADTTGAIAGGLLGALHGTEAIPARWVNVLEYDAEIEELVSQLAN